MKILIAVPTYENIFPDTYKSIYDLDKGGHDCVFDFVRGYDCAAARNKIVKRAQAAGAEYLLMVDNDVILPPDALVNLLEGFPDVCLGYYAHRDGKNQYTGKTSICKPGEFNYTWQYTAEELQHLKGEGRKKMLIHGGGMGCALIKVSIFDRLPFPWYKWVTYDNGYSLSEDLYFCEICGQYGFQVYTDVRVGCGHIFRVPQWPE